MRILKARFRTPRSFLEAYDDSLPEGALFCPTTSPLAEQEPVVVEIHFQGLPNKMMLRGNVAWWRPALPRLRVRAGAMVAFGEVDREQRLFILEAARGKQHEAIRRRHPRIPTDVKVRWRLADSTKLNESTLREISVGGALLLTSEPLVVGDEIVIEITPPGAAVPVPIAGRVTYSGDGARGIRFLYRDGGGSQRLREMVRRIVEVTGGASPGSSGSY